MSSAVAPRAGGASRIRQATLIAMAILAPSGRPVTESSALELAAAIRSGRAHARGRWSTSTSRLIEARNPRRQRDRRHALRRGARRGRRGRRARRGRGPRTRGAAAAARRPLHDQGVVRGRRDAAHLRLARPRATSSPSARRPPSQRLVDAGAIPLGVTNTSELTLWIESENPVWGRTNNAYDPRRTAGGSSGRRGRRDRLRLRPDRPRHRHRRLDPAARPSSTASSATSRRGALVPHTGHYPSPNERGSALLGYGPARPPGRGPDAGPARDRRSRRDRPHRPRGRARRPGGGLDRGPAGRDLRRRDAAPGLARAAQRAHPRRPGAARGRAPRSSASRCRGSGP